MRFLSSSFALCLVTDRGLSRGRSLDVVVDAALRGGVTMIQLREKTCSTREFVAWAEKLLPLARRHQVPLIINDRVDVALAVNADGVHLGQNDLPCAVARRLLGPDKIIGLSVESRGDAAAAVREPVDYLGVSPVYSTATKADTAEAFGLDGLREIRKISRLPLVAIGGIQAGNASEVLRAGADGLAVVSAICSADDPEQAARQLREIINRHQQVEQP